MIPLRAFLGLQPYPLGKVSSAPGRRDRSPEQQAAAERPAIDGASALMHFQGTLKGKKEKLNA